MPRPNDDIGDLRRCRDCGEWKKIDEFHKNSLRPSGRGSYCQGCFNERSKSSYRKRMLEKHGREVRTPVKPPEGYRRCPDCEEIKLLEAFPLNRSGRAGYGRYCLPCHNKRGRANKIKNHGSTRQYHLKRRYNVGQAEFDAMLAGQGGLCAICGEPDPEHVDHDHTFGNVRGILCFNCNGGLGQFKDDRRRLAKAITYLRETTSWDQIHPGVYLLRSPRRDRHPSPSS